MKKVLSLIFIALLITSCGKANDDTNIEGEEGVQEINVISDENVDGDVVVSDENTSVEISSGAVDVTVDSEYIEDDSVVNSKEEDKLIEDAISEIDNIINEIEVDVK